MKIIEKIDEMRKIVEKKNGKKIGFIPTMGYLHEGHISLIKKAKLENDIIIVSIFVNPTQFGPSEDFEKYPRDMERDIKIIENFGGDIVFSPAVEEMYPDRQETFIDIDGIITDKLCGKSRKGHFKGVMTVVNKLFGIIKPDRVYFGQKDAQQVTIIEKMVKELNMNVEIIRCPIVREADGLALSSRNIYLSPEERYEATVLFKALEIARKKVYNGELNVDTLKNIVEKEINNSKIAEIEYVELLDANTLEEIEELENQGLLAVAVKFGKTRLIDNCLLEGNNG